MSEYETVMATRSWRDGLDAREIARRIQRAAWNMRRTVNEGTDKGVYVFWRNAFRAYCKLERGLGV